MANRKEAAEQNKQAEQANTQSQKVEVKTETTANTETNNTSTQNSESAAPAVQIDKKNEYVIVCLKHPQGIKFNLPDNRQITIKGNATHLRGQKAPVLPNGGFGMTTILKEDWEYIKSTFGKSMGIFKAGLIFASADATSAESQAKEQDEIKSGFEPIDITKENKVDALNKVKEVKKEDK